jgi:hypothetical protein
MPVPSRSLKTEMLVSGEMASPTPQPANRQEQGANKNMKAMKTGCHVKD